MCSGKAFTLLQRTQVEVLKGDLRMSMLLWCFLVLFLCSSSFSVVDKARPARWHSNQMQGKNIFRNLKRHSDGTFTSDFTHYLDRFKAKDFVEWLARTKQEGCQGDLVQIAAQI
ncbi:glucagon-1-like [Labrus mixtus]|uniref:glucagon-1-like n=1 Tax=Labrus mixtus TaxID=508554 RepID=UPI0029C0DE39|nr:glucagon-1-like [Labrus mixtus]